MDTLFSDKRFLHDIKRCYILKLIKKYEIDELNIKFDKNENKISIVGKDYDSNTSQSFTYTPRTKNKDTESIKSIFSEEIDDSCNSYDTLDENVSTTGEEVDNTIEKDNTIDGNIDWAEYEGYENDVNYEENDERNMTSKLFEDNENNNTINVNTTNEKANTIDTNKKRQPSTPISPLKDKKKMKLSNINDKFCILLYKVIKKFIEDNNIIDEYNEEHVLVKEILLNISDVYKEKFKGSI
jgi:hypothetical protein